MEEDLRSNDEPSETKETPRETAPRRATCVEAFRRPLGGLFGLAEGRFRPVRQVRCQSCGQFVVPTELQEHLELCGSEERPGTPEKRPPPMIACHICGKEFGSKSIAVALVVELFGVIAST